MLVEMAVADAFGAGFEYANRVLGQKEYHKRNDLSRYWPHPKWGQPPKDNSFIPTKPGMYTDDTQMAAAVAQFLVNDRPKTYLELADAFAHAFHRDPRPGYAGAFYNLLQHKIMDGADFLAIIQPDSRKSGGAMRAAACGLIKDTNEAIDTAMWQASLTHATRDGMTAAAAAALMVHFFYYHRGSDGDRVHLPLYLNQCLPGYPWGQPWRGPVGAPGVDAVRAAITAVLAENSLSGILRRCIAFGGDVDTVAAIAVAAASWADDIEQDLPQVLVDGLENGAFGRDWLAALDQKLVEKYPRPEASAEDDGDDIFDVLKS